MGVLERVIRKCRSALGARIPIIYIVSDSLELIQQVVNSDLLVLRTFNAGSEYRLKGYRPAREFPNQSKPDNVFTGSLVSGTRRQYLQWEYPTICLYRAEEAKQGELEQYIVDHENKRTDNYDVLQNSVIILYSSNIVLSPMVRMYTEFVTVDYPDAREIYDQIKTEAQQLRLTEPGKMAENRDIDGLCERYSTELVGLTHEEIRMTLQQIMSRQLSDRWEHPLSDEERVIGLIRERKKSKMQGGILELIEASSATIGGMKQLTDWLEDKKVRLTESDSYRRERGIRPPKGVLVCGIPGCGKSEAAKAAAKTFDLPLIKMDVGKLMGKYVGESEQNMRSALAMAEAMAPCVLWIDELEKGFSAAGSDGDSGAFKRMFATFLGWMQDNRTPVFIFATANEIGGLPKEFFRSGRFDERFAVYLPTSEECAQIMLSHMRRIQSDVKESTQGYGKTIRVFQEECLDVEKMRQFVDRHFCSDKTVRIAVGSDILLLVNTALSLPWVGEMYPLSPEDWSEALKTAVKDCSFYGDGAENLDSIAISYCRLLRKGMKATTDKPLIHPADYHPLSLVELMAENRQAQRPAIPDSREKNLSGYDRRVYKLLRERINQFSPFVERAEAEAMVRR